MARYWVPGGSGNWNATDTNNWSATTGGASGASVPTSADDVFFDAASGSGTAAVVTATANCRNLDCNGFTGTLTVNGGVSLNTSPTAGGLVRFSTGMTLSGASSFGITTTAGAAAVLTSNGKTLPGAALAGVNIIGTGTVQLADAMTCAGTVTLTSGTLDLNGKTCNWLGFSSSNSNVRTLTTGASTITVTGSGSSVWWMPTQTNMTVNATGSTLNVTGTNVQFYAGFAWWDVNFTGAGVPFVGGNGATSFRNLTRTGTAAKTDGFGVSTLDITVTGTFTANGNSVTNRLCVQALNGSLVPSPGAPRTITAGAVSFSNCDFQDIVGAGAANWNLSAITGGSGDCGGNSGITFTPSATQTATGTSSFTWSTHGWTSRVPLPQDDVVIANAFSASQTVTADMPRLGRNISFVGATGTPAWNLTAAGTVTGNLTMIAGMTSTVGQLLTLGGRGNHTVTTAGVTLGNSLAFAGNYTPQDNITISSSGARGIYVYAGTVNFGSKTYTTNFLSSSTTNTRVLNMATSRWMFNGANQGATFNPGTNLTYNAQASEFVFQTTAANTATLQMSPSQQFSTVTATGTGALVFQGSFNVTNLSVAPGMVFTPQSTCTYVINNWTGHGKPNGYVYLPGVDNNNFTAPDAAPLRLTGSLTIDVKVAMDDWTPTAVATLAAKYGSGTNRGYFLGLRSDGKLQFEWSTDGTNNLTSTSSAATGVADGAVKWVRVVRDNTAGEVKFYTSDDGSAWTQLGTTQTYTAGAIFASTATLMVGGYHTGLSGLAGKLYRARLYSDATQTTKVFDADFAAKACGATTFTESSTNAATVTVTGGYAVAGDGCINVSASTPASAATISQVAGKLAGNYLSVQDVTVSGGATFYGGLNSVNRSGNTGWTWSSAPGRYWVGGTAIWDATAGSKWSATPGGASGAAVPTSADDVFFDASSTGTVTIDAAAAISCKDLDCTGFAGALQPNTGQAMRVYGSVWKLSTGMTYTQGAGTPIVFQGSGVTCNVFTMGKALGHVTIGASGGVPTVLCQDAWTSVGGTQIIDVAYGTFTTNGNSITCGLFTSNYANTRTINLGISSVVCTGTGAAWNFTTITGLTFACGTSSVALTGAGAQFVGGGMTFYTVNMAGSGIQSMAAPGSTFTNLQRNGTASRFDGLRIFAHQTITGTLTLNGNSATSRLGLDVQANGVAVTLTAANVVASNVDFQDITGAGAANWNLSAISGGAGNAGGCSGITFTTAAPQTWTSTTGVWSDPTKWTSRVPLPQDDVIVDVNTTGTLTADMPRLGKSIDFTGFAGTLAQSVAATLYGSLTFATGMTYTNGSGVSLYFGGRSAYTLTSAGKTFLGAVYINAPGGSVTLQDAFITTNYFLCNAGTWNTNSQAVTAWALSQEGALTRGWTFGSSVITLNTTGANNVLYCTSTGMTMSAASATFVIGAATANARSFVGGGFTYGTLTYTVASSPGSLTITGANTFGTINVGAGRPLILPSSATTTVTNMNAVGVPNGYTYLPGVAGNYLSTPDSAALSITGDIDIRARVTLDDWTPSASMMLVDKLDAAGQYSYDFYVTSGGYLYFRSSVDGAVIRNAGSSTIVGLADGAIGWVRATRNATTGDVKFYTASGALANPTAGDFTQLGTTVSAGAGAIFDGTKTLLLGANGGGVSSPLAAKLYRAQIRNGLDGTLVFDADLTTKTCGARSFTESALGATVTINGASAQAGDGSVNLSSSTPGTPATLSKASGSVVADFLSVSDSTATGGAIFFARASGINAGGNTGWVFGTSPKQGASNWNVDSTWSKGVQPTAADWVVIPSGANVTIPGSVTALARSLRVLAGGTLSYASAPGSVLTLGDATADLFNEAVAISASATINAAAGYGLLGFASTSGTVQTIESGGKTLPGLTFNGAGSSYRLSDASVSNGTVTLLRGTFDTNSMACSWDAFTTTGALVRSLLLGTSQVTVASAGTAWHAALTGLTLVAGGSTITVSHAESPTFSGGGATYGTVVFAEAGTPVIAGAGTTFANLTRTGTPVQTDALALAADIVVTGTLGLTGQSIVNRILFCSDTLGVQRRVTAALVVAVNADFRDINADGAFLWDLTAALGGAGDLGNNTGILFVLVGPRVQVGGNPFDVANLAIPDSRVAWSQLSTAGVAEVAVCGWHGTRFAPEVGAYAIVSSTGPLADLVGELVRVQAGSNDVFVYVYSDGDVAEDISLTRRAFMELAELWTEELPVKVTVIAGASQ